METILITGGAGFIGAHMIEHFMHNTDWDIIVLDRLTYAGSLSRLVDVQRDFGPRLRFVFHDFRASLSPVLRQLDKVSIIIHAGAETHVENSIQAPQITVESNVLGTFHMLEAARQLPNLSKFVLISTDEVHGPAPHDVSFKEDAEIRPSNPYSATKAGAEALAFAWARCYKLPVLRSRTMNNFGERQHPEKFVPMTIRKVLRDEAVPIHCWDGQVTSRKWLHARNHADAVLYLLQHNEVGTYHVAGLEASSLDIARAIAGFLGHDLRYDVVEYHALRPGHDLRYSLDDTKLRDLGWTPPVAMWPSLERAVQWTVAHPDWLEG